jgi:hypothetical protein
MVLTAPPTVVEVTRSVEERQDDGDDASARLAGEFLPRGDGNPAQLAVRRRRVFCGGSQVRVRAKRLPHRIISTWVARDQLADSKATLETP